MKNIKRHLLSLLAVPALMLSVAAFAAPVNAAECATGEDATDTGMTLCGGLNSSKGTDQPESLFSEGGVFQTVTNVLLFVIAAVSVVMLIIGGIRYTVSMGDQSAVTSAKNTILYSIVGLLVAILAFAAINFVIGSFAAPEE